MKVTGFDYWLGRENGALIADLQRVYRGESKVHAQDVQVSFAGEERNVNYTIVRMTEASQFGHSASSDQLTLMKSAAAENTLPEKENSDEMRSDKVTGVVLVIEDISKEKRVMDTLGRYMNTSLVQKVMNNDGGSALGGSRQVISVLFADIQGCKGCVLTFAVLNVVFLVNAIAEQLEPSDVVSILNHHYTYVVDAIMNESGSEFTFLNSANI
jgi:hypothetical protein